MEKLKISVISGLMFVDIGLWSAKERKYKNMSIMVDTGASTTTISSFILENLGGKRAGEEIQVTTASGVVAMDTIILSKLKLGNIELKDIEVHSHEFPEECFSDGVIGMNVLEKFNFFVNFDDKIIELHEREII